MTITRRQHMMIWATANVVLVLFLLLYLALNFSRVNIHPLHALAVVLFGYFLSDFVSGAIHWTLDTWFDDDELGLVVAIAREHHTHPQNIMDRSFLEHVSLGSAPCVVVNFPAVLFFYFFCWPASIVEFYAAFVFAMVGTCLFFGTTFHNFGHQHKPGLILRTARRLRLVMTTSYHTVHHRGDNDIRYCAINGWANPICDHLRVWRMLEFVVSKITGAYPRENDIKWKAMHGRKNSRSPMAKTTPKRL